MSDELHSLRFDIQRSVRYHDRRAAYFERLQRITNLIAIFLAGVVLMELAGAGSPWWVRTLAVAGAFLTSADLVIGFSRCADVHRDLKRRFIALEGKIEEIGDSEKIRRRRLSIEAEEPPIHRALDLLCHNEVCAAIGWEPKEHPEQFYRVPWYMRMTANLYRWPNAGAEVTSEAARKRV